MSRRLSVLACLALLAGTVAAARERGETTDEIVTGAWADPQVCNIDTAVSVRVDDVHRDGALLQDKCIAVDGYWRGLALFKHASAAKRPRASSRADLGAGRIGLYARDEVLESAPHRPKRYTIVGVLRRCESAWPEAVMVMGYCHYAGGPILLVSQVAKWQEPGPGSFETPR
jgi:hypothetical protein